MTSYKICSSCVMDTSDPEITFNQDGVCNHCIKFDKVTRNLWYPNSYGKEELNKIFTNLKRRRIKCDYDCILGVSGGLDSSYLALLLKEHNIRPLVVHVDAGWNSELAVSNIERVLEYCGFELHTIVMNWEDMRDLQLAYLKSGIANQDVPQDHAFFSSLYRFAIENGIDVVISGGNIATESVFPFSWHHDAMDAINLKSIHNIHGSRKLKDYRTISFFEYYIEFPFLRRFKVLRPLNYINYNKYQVTKELVERVGYRPYERKHGESIFTSFFQNYYLPVKFGIDKRRMHFSSLILSGQMSREEAIELLKEPLYNSETLNNDKNYLASKLGISKIMLDEYINSPNRNYDLYDNWDKYYNLFKRIQRIYEKFSGKLIRNY